MECIPLLLFFPYVYEYVCGISFSRENAESPLTSLAPTTVRINTHSLLCCTHDKLTWVLVVHSSFRENRYHMVSYTSPACWLYNAFANIMQTQDWAAFFIFLSFLFGLFFL